jgi:L-threonylcarbamoyladenylate synthase
VENTSGGTAYRVKDLLSESLNQEDLDEICSILKSGELIVYPTETLYGLGADPFSVKALEKLVKIKNRPENMPISIAVSDITMMERVAYVNDIAETIYRQFLPGPLTLILRRRPNVHSLLTGGGDTIGIRIPDHPVTLRLINAFGPITATSANIHSREAPLDAESAITQLGDSVALYLDGGISKFQAPSTVLDSTGTSAKIIRKGVISEDELSEVINLK